EAVQKRVVDAGKGYYHRPLNGPDFVQWYRSFGGRDYDAASGKLVFNKAAALRYFQFLRTGVEQGVIERDRLNNDWNRFHQPISDGKVLFWSGGTWNWAEWAQQWVNDRGGEDYLFANFGYAPHPTSAPAHPDLSKWQDAVFRGVSAVESGQATPEQAVDLVAGEMQRTIRDQIIVE